jgi:hypothetical protein
MIENRPTGDAEAVGAINKGLRSQCPGLANEAGLTRVVVVGRGQVSQKAGAGFGRTGLAAKLEMQVECTSNRGYRVNRESSAGKLDLEARSSWRGATGLARSLGLIGDKSWSKQQEQDKMQKAALGQSEGSEGEREKARWRGQEEDEQRQKATGWADDAWFMARWALGSPATPAGLGQEPASRHPETLANDAQ